MTKETKNDVLDEWGKEPEVLDSNIKHDDQYRDKPSLDDDDDDDDSGGLASLSGKEIATNETEPDSESEAEAERERLKQLLEGAIKLLAPHFAGLIQGLYKYEHEVIVFTKDERIHIADLAEYVRSDKNLSDYEEHPFVSKLTPYQRARLQKKVKKSIQYYDIGMPFNKEELKHINVIGEELTVTLFGWLAKLLMPADSEPTPMQTAVLALVVMSVTRTAFSFAIWFDTKK